MTEQVKVGLPTLFITVALVGAAAFAAGRSTSGAPAGSPAVAHTIEPAPDHRHDDGPGDLPPGHPGELPPGHAGELPPGHPPTDGTAAAGMMGTPPPAAASSLKWTVPPRWKVMPNTSSMRLATYQIPRAAGDTADADVSVTQAGGTSDANVERWIGQFEEGARSVRSVQKVGDLQVAVISIEGTYKGGMGMGAASGPAKDWALLGAIVPTPDMAHFFKITGPRKTVASAKDELKALLDSIKR